MIALYSTSCQQTRTLNILRRDWFVSSVVTDVTLIRPLIGGGAVAPRAALLTCHFFNSCATRKETQENETPICLFAPHI